MFVVTRYSNPIFGGNPSWCRHYLRLAIQKTEQSSSGSGQDKAGHGMPESRDGPVGSHPADATAEGQDVPEIIRTKAKRKKNPGRRARRRIKQRLLLKLAAPADNSAAPVPPPACITSAAPPANSMAPVSVSSLPKMYAAPIPSSKSKVDTASTAKAAQQVQ